MNSAWPKIRLGEAIASVKRPTVPLPGVTYRQLGVKLWGEGAYEREPIDGGATKYGTLSRVEANDVVVNKIWARNGSVAVVTEALAGCFVSGEFPTFSPDPVKLMPRWMHWLTKTSSFWAQCDAIARGTSGKNRIRPEQFLQVEVPLPPLSEQAHAVAHVERLAALIYDARSLHRQVTEETKALWRGVLSQVFEPMGRFEHTLESVCDEIIDNLHSTPRYDGDDFPCIRSQDVGWGELDYSAALSTSAAEFAERTKRGEPQRGDIVFVREGDIGRCAVVDGSQRFSLGQRVMMFRPSSRADSRYLMYQLMSPPVLEEQVLQGKVGTTSHHVNVKRLLKIRVTLPALPSQRRIVSHLDRLRAAIDQATRLQTETTKELDALLPAVLHKAFEGET